MNFFYQLWPCTFQSSRCFSSSMYKTKKPDYLLNRLKKYLPILFLGQRGFSSYYLPFSFPLVSSCVSLSCSIHLHLPRVWGVPLCQVRAEQTALGYNCWVPASCHTDVLEISNINITIENLQAHQNMPFWGEISSRKGDRFYHLILTLG